MAEVLLAGKGCTKLLDPVNIYRKVYALIAFGGQ